MQKITANQEFITKLLFFNKLFQAPLPRITRTNTRRPTQPAKGFPKAALPSTRDDTPGEDEQRNQTIETRNDKKTPAS
ncbi:hypothetical protein [Crenobacter luteus]|uniref:hypothetical protein n=1 Tax=Crenobacter luteus TaxID=1452487 RepID=UPI0012E75391|nr:hypothetical protein [Crenobacter luteus]